MKKMHFLTQLRQPAGAVCHAMEPYMRVAQVFAKLDSKCRGRSRQRAAAGGEALRRLDQNRMANDGAEIDTAFQSDRTSRPLLSHDKTPWHRDAAELDAFVVFR